MMKITGIEWDAGNWPKCNKHGVGKDEIEHVLIHSRFAVLDPSEDEPRMRTAGQVTSGRHVFVVYTHRSKSDGMYLRPISARYMHGKEVEKYEQARKAMADPSQ
jgi:uncharacterized DUF497 family protein